MNHRRGLSCKKSNSQETHLKKTAARHWTRGCFFKLVILMLEGHQLHARRPHDNDE